LAKGSVRHDVGSLTPSRDRVPRPDPIVRSEIVVLVAVANLDHSTASPQQHANTPLDRGSEKRIDISRLAGALVREVVLVAESDLVLTASEVHDVAAQCARVMGDKRQRVTDSRN